MAKVIRPVAFMVLEPPDVSGVTPATEITVTIENGTCTFDSPPALQAGQLIVHADVVDEQFYSYAVSFFTLEEDKDLLDLMASTAGDQQGPPSWAEIVFWEEPVSIAGLSQTYEDFYVEEGLLYLVCWAKPQEMPIGNGGPFVVVP